jgi:hypothetical protein
MTANAKPPTYRIYLLTVRHTPAQTNDEAAGWQFLLTDPQTGKRYGFTNPATLLAALQQATSEPLPVETAS